MVALPKLKSQVSVGVKKKIHLAHYTCLATGSSPLERQALDVAATRNRRKGREIR